MSKFLVGERPIIVIPSLAVKLGMKEAIVLQHVHYWLSVSRNEKDGRKWVYNTYEEWKKQLPFWSLSTIKRTIAILEEKGYLLSDNFNAHNWDQTKWYSIDYGKLREIEGELKGPIQIKGGEYFHQDDEETDIPYAAIIQYLNEKTDSGYRESSRKSRSLIRAWWEQGFTLGDFQKVIDLKAAEWKRDPQYARYLRPETLFGSKFEAYLNQKPQAKQLREEDFNLD
ncbi:conserved phage C-terminal domain-containing protein [Cytobacillus firmus]|uniref:conserved phage C-terminal domain-containing protein n=1 Tax=Cytobacillus firmus TaxID=1399 RepID=UPI0018CCF4D2|nr:conserved phage C-terminal domain-containing protein [Cytobacillus firmus]MBG9547347.1 replication protein [Cytobacillus firmus]MBG9603609.1 replication protein [Cytobacillus firmus]MDD9313509.1 conserved phage C-terminal domain-containing protein [Cytobacillus firmus]MED1942041.1 conserved phage C-terminal domain-containing protein [Cytobacillus firmus]